MCRWMAGLGQPVRIEELLFKTQHGIVDQSLYARIGGEPTKGDGFGAGWYGVGRTPGVDRSVTVRHGGVLEQRPFTPRRDDPAVVEGPLAGALDA